MKLTFDRTLTTTLDPASLWALIRQSFLDSSQSPLWPHELEHVRADRVAPGGIATSTYHFLALQGSARYYFSEVREGERIRYQTDEGHPFRGSGDVQLTPLASGTQLRWRGDYDVPLNPRALLAASYVRLYFEPRFFARLEENLRHLEGDL